MSDPVFGQLQSQALELYWAGEYAQALDVVIQAAEQYPHQAQRLYFWQVRLAAKADKLPLAVQLFRQAVESGYWYSEAQLRKEADLAALQGQPAFERLAALCRERQAGAQARAAPALMTLQPEQLPQTASGYPLLMALHANNANAQESLEWWQSVVASGYMLALPQSSQVGGQAVYVWDDAERAANEAAKHFAALSRGYPVDLKRVVLAGFAAGGYMATWLSLKRVIPACGFIAVGARMAEVSHWLPLIKANRGRRLRGYVLAAEHDTDRRASCQAFASALEAEHIACQMETYTGPGYAFPPNFEQSLARALDFVCPK